MTAIKFSKICIGLLLFGGAILSLSLKKEVLIKSIESKTTSGSQVYNRISYLPGKQKDVWLMNQSHGGIKQPLADWDQIKIIVDKTKEPFEVSYYQLQNEKEIELKASCYTCHANGPRAIRPNINSKDAPLGLRDRLSISAMNFRIKLYGKVEVKKDNYKLAGNWREVPLRFFGTQDSTPLTVRTCLFCHHAGELQRQHLGTIKHLTETKQMPPWPFFLSRAEKSELKRFVSGLD